MTSIFFATFAIVLILLSTPMATSLRDGVFDNSESVSSTKRAIQAAQPVVSLTAPDDTMNEPGGQTNGATARLSRSPPCTSDLTVALAAVAVNAASNPPDASPPGGAGADYVAFDAAPVIKDGFCTVDVPIFAVNDQDVEGLEILTLEITTGAGAYIADPDAGTVKIKLVDDDAPSVVTLTVNVASVTEDAPLTKVARFTVSRTGSTAKAITVGYTINPGTTNPAAFADFVAAGGAVAFPLSYTVNLPAGAPSVPVDINSNFIADDNLIENIPESFVVTLSVPGSTDYKLGPAAATTGSFTIVDADGTTAPLVNLLPTDLNGAEPGNPTPTDRIVFTLTRAGPTTGILDVDVNLAGLATITTDYTATIAAVPPLTGGAFGSLTASGVNTLSFPSGVSTIAITVTPVDDTILEPTETIILSLVAGDKSIVAPANSKTYRIGTSISATASISDNERKPVLTIGNDDGLATLTVKEDVAAGVKFKIFHEILSSQVEVKLQLKTSSAAAKPADFQLSLTGGAPIIPTGDVFTVTSLANGGTATFTEFTLVGVDDSEFEDSETFTFTILPSTQFTLGTSVSQSVTLTDSELEVSFSFNGTVLNAVEGQTTGVKFRIVRRGDTSQALDLSAAVAASGSATAVDYIISPTLPALQIPAKASFVEITVRAQTDSTPESIESLILTVTAGGTFTVPASGSKSKLLIRIIDPTTYSILSISPVSRAVASELDITNPTAGPGFRFGFNISRTGINPAPTSAPLTVPTTVDLVYSGSATLGTVTTVSPPTAVVIPPGSNTVFVPVTVKDDQSSALDVQTVIAVITPSNLYDLNPSAASAALLIWSDE